MRLRDLRLQRLGLARAVAPPPLEFVLEPRAFGFELTAALRQFALAVLEPRLQPGHYLIRRCPTARCQRVLGLSRGEDLPRLSGLGPRLHELLAHLGERALCHLAATAEAV